MPACTICLVRRRGGGCLSGQFLLLGGLLAVLGMGCSPGCGTKDWAIEPDPFLAEITGHARAPIEANGTREGIQPGDDPEAPEHPEGTAVAEEWAPRPIEAPRLAEIPYTLIIDPMRPIPGSRSVGSASGGFLVDSRALPLDSSESYVLPRLVSREAYYATDELVDLVERVGRILTQRYPGSRLAMGDASLVGGGEIRRHGSHTSGRDLDILFLVQDPSGRPLDMAGFIPFDASGRSGDLRFDLERNWYLVRSLLVHSDGHIQWIFLSNPLIQMLLDHALQIGEPAEIIAYARDVLHQPRDSSPHDDHFHVRTYCSSQDLLEGCLNRGPRWPWAKLHLERHRARVDELLGGLSDPRPEVRIQVVDFMAKIEGRGAAAALAGAAAGQPPEVQIAILRALQSFRVPGVGREIMALYRDSSDRRVQSAVLEAALSYPLVEAADLLAELLFSHEEIRVDTGAVPACRLAAQALLDIQEPSIIPRLIEALNTADRPTRATVATVLGRTTGRRDLVDWQHDNRSRQERAVERWRDWYEVNGQRSRDEWIREGFHEAGYELSEDVLSPGSLMRLIDALDEAEPFGYLAGQLLRQATGAPSAPEDYSAWRRRDYWLERVSGLSSR